MLFVVYGNDFKKKNLQKNKILETLKKKRPDAVFSAVGDEGFGENFLQQNISSSGLFDDKSVFEIKNSFYKKENESLFEKYIQALHTSENAFVFVEEKLPAKITRSLEKEGVKIYELNSLIKKDDTNLFVITDLFLSRNKKDIWLKYQEFINKGISEEEIFGILFWAIKTLNIIASSADISETSLKPFVYNKNKKYLEKWPENEVSEKMYEMIEIYHNTRRGMVDFKTEVERLILS